ncbi:MAG: EAL domain-containing protein [Marinisporobacter sp.]|jgi:diguanylate cyclase (GGDEF)-like protein|nr:EAL domain-containing protein [Marinisporobacter sp.]
MKSTNKSKKQRIINKYKIIYLPLLIALLAIFTVSITSFYISRELLLKQGKVEGLNLLKQAIRQIESNTVGLEMIDDLLEDRIRVVGKSVIKAEQHLNNEYLIQALEESQVDEIHWMNEKGEIIYSTIKEYIGWMPFKEHPLYSFIRNKDKELMEDIRLDAKFKNSVKYGSIKNEKGYFVQIGILAKNVNKLTERFSYERLMKNLVMEDSIVFATLFDQHMKVIADGHRENIGKTYDYKEKEGIKESLEGKISMKESYHIKNHERVLEISAPVFIGRKAIGVLAIGFSMEKIYTSIYKIFTASSIIAFFMFLLFLWVQNRNVLRPVNGLDEKINGIDLENHIDYRLPLVKKDPFFGLTLSMNKVLDKTYSYLYELKQHEEELETSNEEIIAAYHQLAASEEILRNQYDEIQSYTEKLQSLKQKYEHLAYHDPLTELPNRRSFFEKLQEAMNKNQPGAVILIDLDNFKEINDTLGHGYGDEVLKEVAQTLMSIKNEKIFISRFGGDEFLILIEEEGSITAIENYAKEMMCLLKEKIWIEGNRNYISASIGISRYPFDTNEVNELMMNVDMAMYQVKEQEKNNYMFFKKEMTEKLKKQVQIESILREAIKEDGFKVIYQPQICTSTGKVAGFEALLRLKDHAISPDSFIKVAEENGMIVQMGRWVTKEVINQIKIWKNKGLLGRPIAINFSAKQLNDIDYVSFLEKTLKENDIEAKYIEIEITESVFLDKKEETIVFLNELKGLGIKIALDDFGTGYSSLSYLTFLPVDKIKLDKSLCDKFLEIENIIVMDNIISLAHSLKLEVVAEGVEEAEQYRRLKVAKCDYIQGYLFSKPLENIEAEKIYEDNFIDKLQ